MINIKLSFPYPTWPILRQTPGGKGIWGNCQFFVNDELDEYDYWVVYEGLSSPETAKCPQDHTILITGEPSSVKSYSQKFLNQFAHIVTCQRDLIHRHVIYSQEALPWHVGRRQHDHVNLSFSKDYDELKAQKTYQKDKLLSIITSNKEFTSGHRLRKDFTEKIITYFGKDIDIYGRGFNEIEDKWNAIASYKYHIVLENSSFVDYWTEKLADCYLAGAYPIYYGCTNLGDYFPNEAFTPIDISNFQTSVESIKKCLCSNTYEMNIEKIHECKQLILEVYNLFPLLTNLINSGKLDSNYKPLKKIKLLPENYNYLIQIKKEILKRL